MGKRTSIGRIYRNVQLKKASINPILHQIDNKFPKKLIEEIESRKLKYQPAPRGNHRKIPAKRRIQTLKNYFISVLYRYGIFNELSIKDTTATEETQDALTQFLNYCGRNPNPTIIYQANNIILLCGSDVAYLVAPKSRSQAGRYHYLGNKNSTQFKGPIYVLSKIINEIMGLAVEAEVRRLYMNTLELSLRWTIFT